LPLLDQYESLFNGINDVIAHIAPPITTVFLLGVFWKKASARSAQYTLWFGSLLGAIVFAANKLMPDASISRIPFMMMAFYLCIACIAIQVVLSFVFPAAHTEESKMLYWRSPLDPLKGKAWRGIGNYKLLSALLIAMMIILYWIFR
jgi:SSS family solute:Na+ symporter